MRNYQFNVCEGAMTQNVLWEKHKDENATPRSQRISDDNREEHNLGDRR